MEDFEIAPDGKKLVFITNEDGISKLHLLELPGNKELPIAQLPVGIISDIKWRKDSSEFASISNPQGLRNDVYSVNVESGLTEHWAKSVTNGVDTSKFARPELIHWKTFDNRTLSGFLYRPASRFKGKRPENRYRCLRGYWKDSDAREVFAV